MQKSNISTYRAQRVNEENDVIRLVMFTSKVMVIRMSRMAYLMYFLLKTEKTDQFERDISMHLKCLIWRFYKILWIMVFWPTISKLSTFKNTGLH